MDPFWSTSRPPRSISLYLGRQLQIQFVSSHSWIYEHGTTRPQITQNPIKNPSFKAAAISKTFTILLPCIQLAFYNRKSVALEERERERERESRRTYHSWRKLYPGRVVESVALEEREREKL
ncbi:hypothetical protein HPP92_019585 [Vanilla planifolia]|uniref:Uncharacterized protein n=1 Tax=Vanilla planifolia TaxID=51239 RepID=A0A835Q3K6_VANPL|nr:hypothetical protein HPP92_019585 [Vanilla planifolia]